MPLYFAYGLLMSREEMAKQCVRSVFVGVARLPRHRLFMMADGHASIVRDPRRDVHGVVWDVPFSDMAALERFERSASGPHVKISQPVILDGGAKRALVFVGRGQVPGKSKPEYIQALLAAGGVIGLPSAYLHEIEHGEPPKRKPGAPLFKAPVSSARK